MISPSHSTSHPPSQMQPVPNEAVLAAANTAAYAIPPLWPLASSVAVNPFLGQTSEDLATCAARLRRVAGAPVTVSRSWYRQKIDNGELSDDDLAAAIAAMPTRQGFDISVAALKEAASQPRPLPRALPTVADLAAEISGTSWPELISDRFSTWAAGYFDAGQAMWAAPKGKNAYAAWRAFAIHDLTPEIHGLAGFASTVADAPDTSDAALIAAATRLQLDESAAATYFHRLLMTLGGWAQYARYQLWQAELAGGTDPVVRDLLTIRLIWEAALLERYGSVIADRWAAVVQEHSAPVVPSHDDIVDALLQEATERAAQRGLVGTVEKRRTSGGSTSKKLQAAFCIDVRSEVFRRALESVDPGIETLGFAGFFGLGTAHRRFASDVEERRLPVLLNPGVRTSSGGPAHADADIDKRLTARARRAWGRFRLAAVSSFAFVEATGPVYAARLFRDALGLSKTPVPDDPAPRFDPELDLETRIGTAATVLEAMSLTKDLAPVVLLAGHGANVVNNPHASALHCGACGGYTGEVNARLLAGLLNDPKVRAGLSQHGIELPPETLFVAALHDTTTDEVILYEDEPTPQTHVRDLDAVRAWLGAAAQLARGERALRLPRAASAADVKRRSRDWSEVRPEWALAGCRAFIAAPRHRTSGKDLEGRAFLHNYDWRADKGFGVLELIMTAPVVVASWISLQYYGSTVAPETFGSGNKLLHNVTGGIGVVEGNGGVLRAGLPWQSVHDGERLIHEPLRLTVFVEAPTEAMTDILARHQAVRELFDNRWLHLMAIDDAGTVHARYAGGLGWEALKSEVRSAA